MFQQRISLAKALEVWTSTDFYRGCTLFEYGRGSFQEMGDARCHESRRRTAFKAICVDCESLRFIAIQFLP